MNGSVLVIGGGVAGIRAASELLQQGFKVFLLEREAAIGGLMTRIRRLYPTHEHSACAWFPLTLELMTNPNITLLTSAELLSLEGSPGDFTARIAEHESGDQDGRQETEITVGAVIVAAGSEEEKDESLGRLGYGRLANVLSGLELEDRFSELGPAAALGELGGGAEPLRVTWVVLPQDSPVAFMSAVAQAAEVRQLNPDAEGVVVCEERSTQGKGYEELCLEAERRGVRFVQGSAVEVGDSEPGPLTLSYQIPEAEPERLESDLLVLSLPLGPSRGNRTLAERLGLELDERGFLAGDPVTGHPILTSRPGVFVCGGAEAPKGIGESVIQACAAAARAAVLLAPARSSELVERKVSLSPVAAGDEPEIAVVIDRGADDVAGVLDLDELAEHTRSLAGVKTAVVVSRAAEGSRIEELLGTGEFNRLVVAGPSPITHEALFQRHAETAGLSRYLVEMVNLHDQCARVHSEDQAGANLKAKTLMKMGVVRARRLEPLEEVRVGVEQSCLVMGGGSSGLACAATLAAMGLEVHLVAAETPPETLPEKDHPLVEPLLAELKADERVTVHSPATAVKVSGSVGDFEAELVGGGNSHTVKVGTIVVAAASAIDEASDGDGFAASLELEQGEDGFYLGTQGILNPLDFVTDGVYLCGSARADLGIEQAVVDGEAAASRAACILSSNQLVRSAVISEVVDANCDGCAYCVDPCPTRSITLLEFVQEEATKKVVEVNDRTCIGCGVCMATCPKEGIFVRHFRLEAFAEMAQVALEDAWEPTIVCFCCNRCAYPGADDAGHLGLQYPPGVRIIRGVCAGMIHPNIITETLNQGADGVLVCGCHPGECRSREGIRKAQARAETITILLEDFDLEEERFRLELIAASEGRKFARIANEMTEELSALGPSPYR